MARGEVATVVATMVATKVAEMVLAGDDGGGGWWRGTEGGGECGGGLVVAWWGRGVATVVAKDLALWRIRMALCRRQGSHR